MLGNRLALCACGFLLFSCGGAPTTPTPETGAQASETEGISLKVHDDRVQVLSDGKELTNYIFNTKWDKPFLFPIKTVSGVTVSRGYPVEPREGEEQDHPWHRGIWYGHGDINGVDFWREKGPDVAGRLVLRHEPTLTQDNNSGTITAVMDMLPPGGKPAMGTITTAYTVQRQGDSVLIDAEISIAADKGQALKFGDSDDGGFGIRLSDEFREDRGGMLHNSDGLEGTKEVWGKPALWVDYAATVDGKQVNVAMFDNPSNLRHPERWHARGYSLCSANPFALRSFTGDKTKDGGYTIDAGDTLTLHYRTVISEAPYSKETIDAAYAQYAGQK